MPGAFAGSDRAAQAPDIRVRTATTRDFDVVLELRRALRREERPGEEPIDDQLRAMTRRQLHAAGQVILLAESDGRAIAVLRCALQAPGDLGVSSAVLTTAYVEPAFRRHGIMSRLVHTAEQWCASRGVHDLRLRNAWGNAAANAAWEALGFRIAHVIRQRNTRG